MRDEPGDLVRVGDQRQMACLHLDGLCVHALGHEAFEIRVDRAILGRDRIPAWLRTPGRLRCLSGEKLVRDRPLDGVEDARLLARNIAGEISQESLLAELAIACGPDEPGGGRRRRKSLGERRVILDRKSVV